jgi:phosphate transport system substrate-binding protein
MEREARAFMTLYPGARIEVIPADSRGALVKLFAGEVGIAVLSRELAKDEKKASAEARLQVNAHRIAIDGVAFVVHPRNPVDSLTLAQAAGLFGGAIGSWREVGGEDRGVVPVIRDRNSGTYGVVLQEVVRDTVFRLGVSCRSSREVVDRVASDVGAIGCVGLLWIQPGKVKALRLTGASGGEAVAATASAVYKNRYPLRRPILVCSIGSAMEADLRAGFISFLTSPKGQIVVESEGLVPDTIPERTIQLTGKEMR